MVPGTMGTAHHTVGRPVKSGKRAWNLENVSYIAIYVFLLALYFL